MTRVITSSGAGHPANGAEKDFTINIGCPRNLIGCQRNPIRTSTVRGHSQNDSVMVTGKRLGHARIRTQIVTAMQTGLLRAAGASPVRQVVKSEEVKSTPMETGILRVAEVSPVRIVPTMLQLRRRRFHGRSSGVGTSNAGRGKSSKKKSSKKQNKQIV